MSDNLQSKTFKSERNKLNALKNFLQTDDDLRICLARDDSNLHTRIKEKEGLSRICVENRRPRSSVAKAIPSVQTMDSIKLDIQSAQQSYFFDPQSARLEADADTSDDGLEG